eukprot:14417456-Alexandrium_andersonii.AAC.1
MRNAFSAFCEWASAHGMQHTHPDFTLHTIGLAEGQWSSWPELDAKAHNAMVITCWLADVCLRHAESVHDRRRLA